MICYYKSQSGTEAQNGINATKCMGQMKDNNITAEVIHRMSIHQRAKPMLNATVHCSNSPAFVFQPTTPINSNNQ